MVRLVVGSFEDAAFVGAGADEGDEVGCVDGDYTVFLGRDDAFGILGHPWERTLCVFGEPALTAFTARNRDVLATVVRRDGGRAVP